MRLALLPLLIFAPWACIEVPAGAESGVDEATDAGADGAPEGEGDASPDEAPPLELGPEISKPTCERICADAAEQCDSVDLDTCVAECSERAGQDGWWLGSYECLLAECDPACLEGPAEPVDACEEVCEAVDRCDLSSALDLPEDEPEVCLAVCAGAVAGQEGLEQVLDCIHDGLASCEDGEAAIRACTESSVGCDDLCEEMLDGERARCGDQTPFGEAFPTVQACREACEPLPGARREVWAGCVQALDCEDPSVCADVPAAPDPACESLCEAVADRCDGLPFGEGGPSCAHYCTGAAHGRGLDALNPHADECFAALPECPDPRQDDGDAFGRAFLGCLVVSSPTCERACGILTECDPGMAAECALGCAGAEHDEPEVVREVLACLEAAEGCEAVESCIPNEGEERPDDREACREICERQQDEAGRCGPDSERWRAWPDAEACFEDCSRLDHDQYAAFAGCASATECGDPRRCLQVPVEPDPACHDLCRAAEEVCGASPFGEGAPCAELCTGLAHGFGLERVSPDAGACFAQFECPRDGEAFGQSFVGCMIESSPACTRGCEIIGDCDPQAGVECRFGCNRAEREDPEGLGQILACVEEAEDCEQVGACIPRDDGPEDPGEEPQENPCKDLCERLLGEEGCEPDAPAHAAWDTVQACVDACEPHQGPAMARYMGCMGAVGCGDPAPCQDVPGEPAAECQDLCEAAGEACGEVPFGGACAEVCTGSAVGLGLGDLNADAAECFQALDHCPEDNDRMGQALLGCLLVSSPLCAETCGRMNECGLEGADGCPLGCAMAERESPEMVVRIAACVEAAADCQAVEACIPRGQ